MLIESIALGLVYGFFLFEWSGIVAGGLIAPGYMARPHCLFSSVDSGRQSDGDGFRPWET